MKTLLHNVILVNEGKTGHGYVILDNEFISEVEYSSNLPNGGFDKIIDGNGFYLLPGVIDDQVHFREPGLIHKGDIYTESRAAAAGGVTSFMEMPNTQPQTISIDALEHKFRIAERSSLVNWGFYLGATNDNIDQIKAVDPKVTAGIKVFMGASTGNMLVDNISSLENIFRESSILVATHCEDEGTIQSNTLRFKSQFGDDIPFSFHPKIRSSEACLKSSTLAVDLAKKFDTRLHILHLSTKEELKLFNSLPLKDKRITAEVCVHHLWFDERDYLTKGSLIKWNPAIKGQQDKEALIDALKMGKIDVIATDHAPHTLEEKSNTYFKAPSGGPLVQHSLVAMLEMVKKDIFELSFIVQKMCHNPAELYQIDRRGYIREGYYADLVLVDLNSQWTVSKDNILYKCKWSPFDGEIFHSKIDTTIINGEVVYENNSLIEKSVSLPLKFNR